MVDMHINHFEYCTREVIEGGSSLKSIEMETLGEVKGKTLLHLMCQFGLDSLSWVRQGAIVTGVDISDRSIEAANELKVRCKLHAEFVRADVLELIGKIDSKFDIVFQSYGTHIWISDINAWGRVVSHYLKPGGTFFIVDEHPANVMFLLNPPGDYFAKEPERTFDATDYCQRDKIIKGEMVEWQHSLASIINALINAGLVIEHIEEYNHGYYKVDEGWYSDERSYWYPPDGPAKFPVMMSIKARKPS